MEKKILKTISQNLDLIREFDIKEDMFYDSDMQYLFKDMDRLLKKGYVIYDKEVLNNSETIGHKNMRGALKDLRDQTLRSLTQSVLKSHQCAVKSKDVDLNKLLEQLRDSIDEISFSNYDSIRLEKAISYLDKYKQETIEMENSKKNKFYTFSHPVLEKYLRMEKGWNISLIGGTGSGKSLMACMLTVDFAIRYNEPCLFITDENSESTILQYLKCHYLGLHYRSVQDRTIKLDEYVETLSKKDRMEYDRVFNLIQVWELSGINTNEVRMFIKQQPIKYGLLVIDSFDELNSISNLQEVVRYDRNAKEVEVLAKELDLILLCTAQTKSDYYRISAEKLPMLCNHNAKTLVKKNFASIVIHSTFNKKDEKIDDVIKLNKCRSGGHGVIYGFNKNYDYINIEPEEDEYNLNRIKHTEKDKEFDF